jgi:hypothetical protein
MCLENFKENERPELAFSTEGVGGGGGVVRSITY